LSIEILFAGLEYRSGLARTIDDTISSCGRMEILPTKVVTMTLINIGRVIAFSSLILFAGSAIARQHSKDKKDGAHDLDELMAKVWQNCKIDLDNLRGYIFNETDSLYGKKFLPHMSDKALVQDRFDYVWTAKGGYLGPSLIKINGKDVWVDGKKIKITQKAFSLTWDPAVVKLYAKWRQSHQAWEKWDTILDFFDDLVDGWSERPRYGRFEYKPRKYTYVGSKEFEGHNVIEINYPIDGRVSATPLVTMLIIPDEAQLVAVALSVQWSASQVEYSMTMDNSHDNVWLPKEFRQIGTASWGGLAPVSRDFDSYAKTDVKAKFWFEDVKTKIWFGKDTPQPKK